MNYWSRVMRNVQPNLSIYQRTCLFYFVLVLIGNCIPHLGIAQTTIYSDNFNNGCAASCLATSYNGWTLRNNDGGVSGGDPNIWYVSCTEEGVAPPGCGTSCVGDATLHIGSGASGGGDMGASFNETGAVNATFRTAVSPTINTTGFTTNTLTFDFIAYGSASCSDDRAQLRLSTDNGATWPVGFQYCLTSVCCGACNGYSQGQWTTYTLALPAAFNNNPNVRVGFNWRNNGNGSGTDPSVAVDDVRITTIPLPVRLLAFQAREDGQQVRLQWSASDAVDLSRYEIERALSPTNFERVGSVAATNGEAIRNYSFSDRLNGATTVYYRLKMVDDNGSAEFSNVLRVVVGSQTAAELVAISPSPDKGIQLLKIWAAEALVGDVEVRDMAGRLVKRFDAQHLVAGENKLPIDLTGVSAGAYLVTLKVGKVPTGMQAVNATRRVVIQ
jgi:hypothetical protein